jgi:hypothetical protein
MSSQTPQPQAAAPPVSGQQQEIKIVSHSNLFYWWPLWAVGFVTAALTLAGGHVMGIVPKGTKVLRDVKVEKGSDAFPHRDVLMTEEGKHLPEVEPGRADEPYMRVAESKSYGVIYIIVLLLLIVITNVPLRGLWSVVVIIVIVMLTIIFGLAGWWEPILNAVGSLHVQINMAGYLVLSAAMLLIWVVTFFLFDPQVYMIFTPGQLRVQQVIGGGETSYDTTGMVIQKQRNDLFRHWILGLGSGDLIVNTFGANPQHFDLPNVLFVGYKVQQIEDMLREKPVVQ